MSELANDPLSTDGRDHLMSTAIVEPFVVTVDEVRALARLRGASLPAALADDAEPDPRVDAAAVRGLAARGLAAVDGTALDGTTDVVPSPVLGTLLAILDAATTIVEVDIEDAGDDRRAVAAGGPAGTAALIEGPAGVWRVIDVDGDDLIAVVAALAGSVLAGPEPEVPVPGGGGFSCPAAAHVTADDRLAAGDAEGAVTVLVGAGVAADAAHAWVAAVADRRAAVAVHVAHADGPGRWRVDELRVVVGPDGRRWRLDVVDEMSAGGPGRWDDHHEDRPAVPHDVLAGVRSVTTSVDVGAVRAALADMCERVLS